MDNKELREKWPEIKEKIKGQHPELKEEDLEYKFGQETELLLRLQKKLKKTNEQIRYWLSLFG